MKPSTHVTPFTYVEVTEQKRLNAARVEISLFLCAGNKRMHLMVMKLINTAITFQMITGRDAINKSSADATHATALHVLKWQFTSSPALRRHNASRVLYNRPPISPLFLGSS